MEYKQKYPKYYPKNFGAQFHPMYTEYVIFFTTTRFAILVNPITNFRKRRKCTDEDCVRLQIEKDYYKIFFNI